MMRKSSKKVVCSITAALMAVTCLAGCTGGQTGSSASANPAGTGESAGDAAVTDGEQITLRYSWWGGEERHNATLKAIARYEELHPNIHIEPEYSGFDGYQQKLITQLSGQTAPDIASVDQPWLADINKQGDLLMDLYTLDEIDPSQYDQDLLKNCLEYDGHLVGLPTGANTNVLLYNVDVCNEKGIDLSQGVTWSEITELGASLHEADPNFYLLNVEQTTINMMLQSYLQNLNGKYIFDEQYNRTFTEEQLAEGFRMVVDWLDRGVIEPVESSSIYLNRWYENPKWINGELGAAQLWMASQSTLTVDGTIDVGVAPMIKGEEGSAGTGIMIRPSLILTIPTSCKHPEEAAEFITWMLTDPEAIEIQGQVRGVPAVPAARDILVENGTLPEESYNVFTNASETGAMVIPNLPTGDMEQIWLDVIQQVEYKVVTPEEGAATLVSQFDDLLESLKANL